MRNIIRVLLNEGIEREDVVAICKYIKEEYDVAEGVVPYMGVGLDKEIKRGRGQSEKKQKEALEAIAKANKELEEREEMVQNANANNGKYLANNSGKREEIKIKRELGLK